MLKKLLLCLSVALLLLGALFGALVHRTDFCTMGSVADIVGYGDWTRMRQWAMAIAVSRRTVVAWMVSSPVRVLNSVPSAAMMSPMSQCLNAAWTSGPTPWSLTC